MPTGAYERSPDQKERLRKMLKSVGNKCPKGKRLSVGTEFKKGNTPWNKGKPFPAVSGDKNPNKRPEVREKVSRTRKANAHKIYYPAGDKHPMWKGGKTPLIMKIRHNRKSIEWRDAIFKRDAYTCKVCGDKRGHNLNAHHYVQIADIIHTLNIKSVAEALRTPVLWKLSNGVTLCTKCHAIANEASKAIKTIYGGCYE